jgi:hypothetical protein
VVPTKVEIIKAEATKAEAKNNPQKPIKNTLYIIESIFFAKSILGYANFYFAKARVYSQIK